MSWIWGAPTPGGYVIGNLTEIDVIATLTLLYGLLELVLVWRKPTYLKSGPICPIAVISANIPAIMMSQLFAYGNTWSFVLLYLMSFTSIYGLLLLWAKTSDTHTPIHTLNEGSEPEPTLTIQPPDIHVIRHTPTHTSKDQETDPET